MSRKDLLTELIVFFFVVLFLYAAGSKLTAYNTFVAQIGKSALLTNYAPILGWLVPTVEIIIALLFLIPLTRHIAMYASFGIMLLFTLYITVILTASTEVPCSCGGILATLGWVEHLIFNIASCIAAIAGIFLTWKPDLRSKKTAHPLTR